ncbi:glucose regulated protein 78 [Diaporthe helianthi]|uniref:Glucose regulated protein 78 n=1 Tax=Diaporthe helianthi TaxID=158607 RepID=A0A2P5HEL3_DIAHE|nr:glucose regulated protein 78 [Diaporthe helianthi]
MLASPENKLIRCLWFAIFCVVVILAPGTHADCIDGHHDPERGAIVGMDLGSETIEGLHYRVVEGKGDSAVISMNIKGQQREFDPESITGILMSRLRVKAVEKLGEEVAYAVVAVPGHFNDDQRRSIESAGADVGLEVLRFINDYAAAGIAHEIDRAEDETYFIVMDLGASKTEVSAIVVEPRASIASQCAMEGTLLDQRAHIELEQSLELAQSNRSFGPSEYCLRTEILKHCLGMSSCTLEDSIQDLGIYGACPLLSLGHSSVYCVCTRCTVFPPFQDPALTTK